MKQQLALGHPRVAFGDWRAFYDSEEITAVKKNKEGEEWVLEVEAKDLPTTTFIIDAKTGDIREIRGATMTEIRMALPTKTVFSDYRKVKGMRIPFRTEMSNEAIGTVVMTLENVETNLEADPKRFTSMPKE